MGDEAGYFLYDRVFHGDGFAITESWDYDDKNRPLAGGFINLGDNEVYAMTYNETTRKYVADNYPDQTWNKKFRSLLLDMKSAKEKALAEGMQELSEEQKRKFMAEYDEIIRLAFEENPMPADDKTKPAKRGRKKKGKVRSLIERLATNKDAVCLFAMDFRVPFDNNRAEQDIRCIKIKSKVSGSFRTLEGAQEYLDIMSYTCTARKLGFNGYEALAKALNDEACYIFA